MVKIGEYRDWTIEYEDGMFSACKGKKKHTVSFEREKDLKKSIDDEIDAKARKRSEEAERKQKEIELKQKQKELRKRHAGLLDTKITANLQDFRNFIRRLRLYGSDVLIKASVAAMHCTGMDPANVLMFGASIDIERIKEAIEFIIEPGRVWKVVENLEAETVTLTFQPMGEGITLQIKTDDGNGFAKVRTVEDDYERETLYRTTKVPDLKHDVVFSIASKAFYHEIEKCRRLEGSMQIEVTKNQMLKISCLSEDDLCGYSRELLEVKGKARSKYSKEYLMNGHDGNFMYFSDSKELTVSIGKDYPMRIDDEKGNWIILAPRVEN